MHDNKLNPVFPEISQGSYILDMMKDIGYCKPGAMGMLALDWVDIKAFSDLTGIVFTKEEAILIKKLSDAYVSQLNSSKYVDSFAPYLDSREIDNGFELLFKSL